MFYVNHEELQKWRAVPHDAKNVPPYTGLLDAVERKLRLHPLIEYGGDEQRLLAERSACRVNAPRGRILV